MEGEGNGREESFERVFSIFFTSVSSTSWEKDERSFKVINIPVEYTGVTLILLENFDIVLELK